MEDLLNYLYDYPFKSFLNITSNDDLNKLLTELKKDWQDQYKYLSNYVHSSNTKFLDLHAFLEDIKPTVESIQDQCEAIKKMMSFLNTVCILCFYQEYQSIESNGKTFIRNAITTEHYKAKLISSIGEI